MWFKQWIIEGYSLRQLAHQGRWSQAKLKQIKTYWLDQQPPLLDLELSKYQHLVCDGTYFRHTACLMVLWDALTHKPIASTFCTKENYNEAVSWFRKLKESGLMPVSLTTDGQTKVIQAAHEIWPNCLIQRCIYHIIRQGEMWLRRFPRSILAQDLKHVLYLLGKVNTPCEQEQWWKRYQGWKQHYQKQLLLLNAKDRVESDIIRAYRMVDHAYENMFHYLQNKQIPKTSNGLEGYFSHLKKHYRQHAGLRREHLHNYLLWYLYLKLQRE